jgi:hypothetical protein
VAIIGLSARSETLLKRAQKISPGRQTRCQAEIRPPCGPCADCSALCLRASASAGALVSSIEFDTSIVPRLSTRRILTNAMYCSVQAIAIKPSTIKPFASDTQLANRLPPKLIWRPRACASYASQLRRASACGIVQNRSLTIRLVRRTP